MNYFIYCLKNYFNFSGRATRSEFWYFTLFCLLFGMLIMLIEYMLGIGNVKETGILSLIFDLALVFPSLAVSTRRLHDTNRSGWWNLIMLVPIIIEQAIFTKLENDWWNLIMLVLMLVLIIGIIVLIVFYCQDSKEDNKYGVNPKKIILQ